MSIHVTKFPDPMCDCPACVEVNKSGAIMAELKALRELLEEIKGIVSEP